MSGYTPVRNGKLCPACDCSPATFTHLPAWPININSALTVIRFHLNLGEHPECRVGLYKQLAELKNVVSDYRESPAQNAALKGPIVELLAAAGLEQDCPFQSADGQPQQLSPEAAAEVDDEVFAAYAGELNTYLQVDAAP